MSSLHEIEHHFFSDILRNNGKTLHHIAASKRLAKNRFDIYQNGYRLRLIDLLEKNYPALRNAIGKRAFAAIANQYIDAVPSRQASARFMGDQLPAFLEQTQQLSARNRLLAALEIQLEILSMAANDVCMTLDYLRTLPSESWASLPLKLRTATLMMTCSSGLPEQWNKLLQNKRPKISHATNDQTPYLFWRNDYHHMQFVPLNTIDALLLSDCQNGTTFGECCEKLMAISEENPAEQAAHALSRWISWGVLAQ